MKKNNKHNFDNSIFREYDIRGIVGKTLTVQDSYFIGYNFAKQIKKKFNTLNIIVGYDGRLSSPILENNLIQGLYDCGACVTKIGLCSSPMLYFSSVKLKADGAIMITGSHNPSDYNGFKILSKEGSYYGKKIKSLSKKNNLKISKGSVDYYNIINSYIAKLVDTISFDSSKLKVVWDPGNGSSGIILKNLLKHIPGKHILINGEVDGTFPSHHPDPIEEKNLKDIKKSIKKNNADIGIAFDGDCDRLGVLDSNGKLITGDKLLLLFALDLLKSNPSAKIIADVKASDNIFDEINKNGGCAIMSKTGHSLIKTKMKETNALLAGEMSGHIFFADKYYGFDDALYAAIRLLNILSEGFSLNKFLNKFKNIHSTPEIKVFCKDNIKFKIMNRVKKIVSDKYDQISYLDGVRVTVSNGWWLIRASNTQPALIVRCEANSKESLNNIINNLKVILLDLGLKFNL
ncbi:MAG: phosphomannomutase [Rickettsiales bacterium]|nr:phosphomannomutase [Rickettsiales bacterium]OUV80290.1 MAG: hypothetical protein CBC91_03135 [Rickettsiales bacterium TMED131]